MKKAIQGPEGLYVDRTVDRRGDHRHFGGDCDSGLSSTPFFGVLESLFTRPPFYD
jgi:hypothetical protein